MSTIIKNMFLLMVSLTLVIFTGCGDDLPAQPDDFNDDFNNRIEDTTNNDDLPVELEGPCIFASVPGLDFGVEWLPGHGTLSRTITLTNCSRDTELEIYDLRMQSGSDQAYRVGAYPAPLPNAALTLPVGGVASVVVDYMPLSPGTHQGALEIRSTDLARETLLVPVTGEWINRCPTAQLLGKVKGSTERWAQTIPVPWGATIELDGSMSTDQDSPESLSHYHWRLTEKPEGSEVSLAEVAGQARWEFIPDVAGTYEIELEVYDSWGMPGCEPAWVRIIVEDAILTNADIRIEITWDTPLDLDPTDDQGSDFDLHFLHPQSDWNEDPWDCTWNNPQPNWGDPDSSEDDPLLFREDADGPGPEIIVVNDPEPGTYRVGIFYKDDHGFGRSRVDIKIFIGGEERLEYGKRLNMGEFWDVATITWPEGTVDLIDSNPINGFP